MNFISAEEFPNSTSKQKEASRVLRWMELPQGKIFCKVLQLQTCDSLKYNKKCYILTLSDNKGDSVTVRIAGHLVQESLQKSSKQILFLTSLRQERIKGNKKINTSDLYMKDGSEDYQIQNEA